MNNNFIITELRRFHSYLATHFRMERMVTNNHVRRISVAHINALYGIEASLAAYRLEEIQKKGGI